jgi:hypothetical protein
MRAIAHVSHSDPNNPLPLSALTGEVRQLFNAPACPKDARARILEPNVFQKIETFSLVLSRMNTAIHPSAGLAFAASA